MVMLSILSLALVWPSSILVNPRVLSHLRLPRYQALCPYRITFLTNYQHQHHMQQFILTTSCFFTTRTLSERRFPGLSPNLTPYHRLYSSCHSHDTSVLSTQYCSM
ncbi:uncharacterized protein F5147DRAFT_67999 [Suillus discolor]|uniref:Secreted protein n=1 Tax=Suillus discolor TaxID=1912936 RepID=A0A9P7JLU9_9AGAM|nr:uncharacterized protein F5147DRAFT_67999 [Suillus discolor]KAG2087182.1 hypothetical protein F5147DRAFT_67999 [Suillus discolor]